MQSLVGVALTGDISSQVERLTNKTKEVVIDLAANPWGGALHFQVVAE